VEANVREFGPSNVGGSKTMGFQRKREPLFSRSVADPFESRLSRPAIGLGVVPATARLLEAIDPIDDRRS